MRPRQGLHVDVSAAPVQLLCLNIENKATYSLPWNLLPRNALFISHLTIPSKLRECFSADDGLILASQYWVSPNVWRSHFPDAVLESCTQNAMLSFYPLHGCMNAVGNRLHHHPQRPIIVLIMTVHLGRTFYHGSQAGLPSSVRFLLSMYFHSRQITQRFCLSVSQHRVHHPFLRFLLHAIHNISHYYFTAKDI